MPSTMPIPAGFEGMKPENDSVFDPLYQTLLKKAARATGMDDPQSQLMAATTPTALISKIPFDKVPVFNNYLISMLKNQGREPNLIEAAEFAAKKYPRTLAHVSYIDPGESGIFKPLGAQRGVNEAQGVSALEIKPGMNQKRTAETLGHELTHAAQQIWNGKDFTPMYKAANDSFGYGNNIFETGAETAGKNFYKKMQAAQPPVPGALERFLGMFQK